MANFSHADMARYFRLGLDLGISTHADVVQWADAVVRQEDRTDVSIIDLCLRGAQSKSMIVSLLAAVPGCSSSEAVARMLLGRACRGVKLGQFSPQKILRRLYLASVLDSFSAQIDAELSAWDDALSLAEGGVAGSVEEVSRDFMAFLEDYELACPERA